MAGVDIVDFVEKEYGAKLVEWQKEYLRMLDREYGKSDARIAVVSRGVGRMFTYFKLKELISNGATNDR